MKYLFGIACLLSGISTIQAQGFNEYKNRVQSEFNQYKSDKVREFEAYRKRVNEEYADFMRRTWPEFKAEPALPVPPSPEPPKPVVVDPDEESTEEPLPYAKVTPIANAPSRPIPLLPTVSPDKPSRPLTPDVPPSTPRPVEPTVPDGPTLSFGYYGRECVVTFDESLRFSLSNIDEKSVAKAWERLAGDASVGLVESCIDLRESMRLSDWGYFKLVEKLSDKAFPGRKNESNLLQMFLLTQSGYKARIGRCADRLVVLIPSKEQIYNYSFIPIKGVNYYMIDRSVKSASTYVYDREFPREQMFSLAIETQPQLPIEAADARQFTSSYGSGISTEIAVNQNLIDFYNEYPLSSHWNINANASLSEDVKAQLYPVLREAIVGKSERDAANILLRFVQTAFEYKTDNEQFGIERSFFPDETFFYPYSDCEDRAILYSVLVRELLGLDAVLIYYPGHLATAVRFGESVSGDYFEIEGRKYIVCDPTYINSNVGMAMPQFKRASAEIIKL